MTKKQFKRWESFSVRMAKHAYPNATEARQAKIVEAVKWLLWIFEGSYKNIIGWDYSANNDEYICDRISRLMYDRGWERSTQDRHGSFDTKFSNQVSCCVRAGLDLAAEPSAGVVGFDVGMLRRMYSGKIPTWVSNWFEPPITSQNADSEGVWL